MALGALAFADRRFRALRDAAATNTALRVSDRVSLLTFMSMRPVAVEVAGVAVTKDRVASGARVLAAAVAPVVVRPAIATLLDAIKQQ